jgi:glucuronate isomerase
MSSTWNLPDDRYFDPDPAVKRAAIGVYERVRALPVVSPHGHVDPRLFSDPAAGFGSPADLLIIPDHYVFRMLHSQGVPLEDLGLARLDGVPVEGDHRAIWRRFCEHFALFRGTPSGMWLAYEFKLILRIEEVPCAENAGRLYDQIAERLNSAEFRPRAVFDRFNIEVLATTDAASDSLEAHAAIRAAGSSANAPWKGRIIPTFRPDAVVMLDGDTWRANLTALERVCGREIDSYAKLIAALQERRAFFQQMGATASDHGVFQPLTEPLAEEEAERIFARALAGQVSAQDAASFGGHILSEMARMSCADGMVMQLHPGSFRNHSPEVLARFGRDKGYDIPAQTEYTRALRPLLAKYGADPRLTLILFTLDETNYAREMAPLAGVYPALRLGPPWWFHDSWNGMRRYFDQVMETTGIYNTSGFNDDTRGFLSIPARHDLWRRAAANWLGGLVARGILAQAEAEEMAVELAYGLAKKAYRL